MGQSHVRSWVQSIGECLPGLVMFQLIIKLHGRSKNTRNFDQSYFWLLTLHSAHNHWRLISEKQDDSILKHPEDFVILHAWFTTRNGKTCYTGCCPVPIRTLGGAFWRIWFWRRQTNDNATQEGILSGPIFTYFQSTGFDIKREKAPSIRM